MLSTKKRPKAEKRNRPLAEIEAEQERKKRPARWSKKSQTPKEKGKKAWTFPMKGKWSYLLIIAVTLAVLGVANNYHENMVCRDIDVEIIQANDNHFLNILELKKIIGLDYGREIIGEKMNQIGLMEIEEALLQNPFILDAEVYKSIMGILHVEVSLRKPMARVLANGESFYLDEEGMKFPLSNLHAANVPIVRLDCEEKAIPQDTIACEVLQTAIAVFTFIHSDPFWQAQVSEVVMEENGEIKLYPQMGDLYVEFGKAENIEAKFEKLRLFYDQIIPKVGWDHYKGVSVAFRGQVVGKKK